jgi:hypoxanthine-guanine phosphoribosyltransferase
MSKLVAQLRAAGAMSVRVVVLLDKRNRRKVTFDADYVGAYCPDEFVVGYGIDYGRSAWTLSFAEAAAADIQCMDAGITHNMSGFYLCQT